MGTAIALLVRKPKHKSPAVVRFRDLWGQAKREELVASLERFSPQLYDKLTPARPLGLPFRPLGTEQDYLNEDHPLVTQAIAHQEKALTLIEDGKYESSEWKYHDGQVFRLLRQYEQRAAKRAAWAKEKEQKAKKKRKRR